MSTARQTPVRKPDLTAIVGWQYDRRRAIAVLDHHQALARRRGDEATAMAMWSAAYDLRTLLLDRAGHAISESVEMFWAHGDTYQAAMAARRGVTQ